MLLHLAAQLLGAGAHLLAQGPEPQSGQNGKPQADGQQEGSVSHQVPHGDPARLQTAQPFVVEQLIGTVLLDNRQPFAESGQQLFFPFSDGKTAVLVPERLADGPQVVQAELANPVQSGKPGNQGKIIIPIGHQLQCINLAGSQRQILIEPLLHKVIMTDVASVGHDTFSGQIGKGFDRRRVSAGKDGIIDDGMMRAEVVESFALGGVHHILNDVDLAPIQALAGLVPGSQANFHLHPHGFTHSTGQFDVETGGFAAGRIDKAVGGEVVGATDKNGTGANCRRDGKQ